MNTLTILILITVFYYAQHFRWLCKHASYIVLTVLDIDDSASSADSAIHLLMDMCLEKLGEHHGFQNLFLRTISLGLSYRSTLGVLCRVKWKYLDVEK